MEATAGLVLALVCAAIAAAGFAFACVAWRPRPDSAATAIAVTALLATGGGCLLLAALHTIGQVLP